MINGTDLQYDVKKEVINEFREMFSSVKVEMPFEVIEYAVDDVFETSAILDEGYFTLRDIRLACQRTILHFMDQDGH